MVQKKNRTISWDDLHLVLMIARECSMAGAAKKMNVNASTISRRLDALEEQWQARIFDRTSKGLEKTELTERLLPFAEAAEQAVNGFIQVLEEYEQEAEGTVVISAMPGFASFFLAPRLQEIRRQYPHIQIQIDAETNYADLSRRKADIALRTHRPQSGDLIATRLLAKQYGIMAHPDYCKTIGLVHRWEEIGWLTWGRKLAHLENCVWIAQRVPDEAVILRSDSFDVLVQAAKSGLGAMFIDKVLGKQMGLEEVKLEASLQEEVGLLPEGAIWMVGHRALRNVPRIAAIWNALLKLSQDF